MTFEEAQKHPQYRTALDELARTTVSLSDMDYSYNPETKKYDIPAVEWDGCYGKHWQRFESEEARTKALDEHESEWQRAVIGVLVSIDRAKAERRKEAAGSRNTIGNLFPELLKF